jgi:tetratricopeptide (TPR) repeat protein
MDVVGRIYYRQGKLAEAERILVKVLEGRRRFNGEEHFEVLLNTIGLAGLYVKRGKLPEAEELLRRARAVIEGRAPDARKGAPSFLLMRSRIYGDLGAAYERAGRSQEAGAAYREARSLIEAMVAEEPDQPETQNNLAWLLATCPAPQLRDPALAVELARKAIEKTPLARYWNTLGVALYRAGDWSGAIEALEKSEALDAGHYLAFDGLFLAMAHWQLGREPEARTWYDRSVAWMEKNRPPDRELDRFRAEAAALLGRADLPADVFAGP